MAPAHFHLMRNQNKYYSLPSVSMIDDRKLIFLRNYALNDVATLFMKKVKFISRVKSKKKCYMVSMVIKIKVLLNSQY